ncbi:MAG: PTS sugar transporter subunit IIA [Pseudomonadota bacterium]
MSIDLSVLLRDGLILDVSSFDTRKDALTTLSDALAEKCGLDTQSVFEAVIERENLGSTGVGEGVAIPHARLKGVEKPVGAFLRLSEGVNFDAIDGKPCDLIFMLLAPIGSGADHLRALAQVSRAFRDANLREKVRKADHTDAIRAILCPDVLSKTAA